MRSLTRIIFLIVFPVVTAVAAPEIVAGEAVYRYSPPVADFIADRSSLRTIVRVLLAPIVFTIENPALAAFAFLGFVAAIWGWRRRPLGRSYRSRTTP